MTGQPLLRDKFTCVLENASKKIGTRNFFIFLISYDLIIINRALTCAIN